MNATAYFDMCEQLGSEPIESEVPISLEDLPEEAQKAWEIYSYLSDRVDTFSGTYFGKSLDTLESLLNLFDVNENKRLYLSLVTLFDRFETEQIRNKPKK